MLKRLRPLLPYLTRYKKRYVIGLAALVITQLVGVAIPLIVKVSIDSLREGVTRQRLLLYAGALLGVALTKAVFQYWMRWVLIGISRDVEYDLRNDLFRHLMRLEPRYYNENRTGDLMSKMTNDLSAVRNMVGPGIMYSANMLVMGPAAIALMLYIDPRLTLLCLLPLPLASLMVKFLGQQIHEQFEKVQAMHSELMERARENFSGVRVVRAFCQEDAEIASFDRMNQAYVDKNRRLIWIQSLLWPGLALLFAISFLLIMVAGGRDVLRGEISVGSFFAFNMYLMYLIWPIIALGWVTNIVQRGLASLGRLWTIFHVEPRIDDRDARPEAAPTIRGDIEMRNLSFSYNGSPILKNLSLKIPAGRTVAVVGATGSGKSTLASLIPRLYDAPPGTLLIDGVPIREIPLATLRRQIGFVSQEAFLFSDTVRGNIKFGAPGASDEEVTRAAEISNILPEIQGFPKGFETMVGERGLTLSGGQKQRVTISRAVLRDPRILILDDALSNVDTGTEETILNQLTGILAGRTTILISHRISTIRNADEIVVLHDGEIVERGTHEELLALNGHYTALYNKQLIEESLEKEV
jgi:ATP-binding cassette subfamily B multidrug efflux pump